MAGKHTYTKVRTDWKDDRAGATPVLGADYNTFESGISNAQDTANDAWDKSAYANVAAQARGGSTVFAIGDSITTLGYTDQGSMTKNVIGPTSYLMWATLLSNGRLIHKGASGTSGYTTAQILATHLPVAIAAAPVKCVVMAGVNDAQSAVALATTIANLTAIFDGLVAAGIEPIACTVTPITGTTTAIKTRISNINSWLSRYCQKKGYTLVRVHAAVVDSTSGDWISGYTSDNIHPTAAGAKAIGQAIASAVAPSTSPVNPNLVTYNGDPGFLFGANQLFLVDTNADGVPDGWSAPTGSPTMTNPTNGSIIGKYTKMVRTAADGFLGYGSNTLLVAGNVIYVAFRIGATVEASGGNVTARLINVGATQYLISLGAFTKDIPDGAVFAAEVTVPAGLANYSFFPQLLAAGVAGAEIRVGQLTMLDLTALGVL